MLNSSGFGIYILNRILWEITCGSLSTDRWVWPTVYLPALSAAWDHRNDWRFQKNRCSSCQSQCCRQVGEMSGDAPLPFLFLVCISLYLHYNKQTCLIILPPVVLAATEQHCLIPVVVLGLIGSITLSPPLPAKRIHCDQMIKH